MSQSLCTDPWESEMSQSLCSMIMLISVWTYPLFRLFSTVDLCVVTLGEETPCESRRKKETDSNLMGEMMNQDAYCHHRTRMKTKEGNGLLISCLDLDEHHQASSNVQHHEQCLEWGGRREMQESMRGHREHEQEQPESFDPEGETSTEDHVEAEEQSQEGDEREIEKRRKRQVVV